MLDAGYESDAAVSFVETGNFNELVGKHTGRISVQLVPMDDETGQAADSEEGEGDSQPDQFSPDED